MEEPAINDLPTRLSAQTSAGTLPTRSDVVRAQQTLGADVHKTPVLTSRSLNKMAGVELFFKCENLQRTGSFKIRGALNAARSYVQSSDGRDSSEPLVTHSSGNHGAALALAGKEVGRKVVVVVPGNAPESKKANIARYGAETVFCGPTISDREAALATVLRNGGHVVPPYNDGRVMAGQGTLALELVAEVPDLDELWVPVGGGGMASGCVAAVGDAVQVHGVEPELADDAWESLTSGTLVGPRTPVSVADGLRGALGPLTFEMLRRYELPIHRVSEAQIIAAQRLLMECLKVVVEPSGAVVFAAALEKTTPGKRLGLVISGGNLDL